MTSPAVVARGLVKTYTRFPLRRVQVVDGMDLEVPAGGVHALIGPNGSGKTTTLRMLLGLVRPDAGTVHVLGHEVPRELATVVGRVGAVIEQPKLFPAMSGRRNLELLALASDLPASRIDAVLDEVGLRDRDRDPVRRYSLGMRQRLATAAALLKEPDLVVLDEPTNGLDPEGIHAVRALVRRIADAGRTVLVASHALADLELVADTASVLASGRLVAQGRVAELVQAGGGARLRVRVAEPERAAAVLSGHGVPASSDGDLVLLDAAVEPALVSRLLADAGLYPQELTTVRPDLESAYLALTGSRAGAAEQEEAR